MQPTGDARAPTGGTTFKDGPRPQPGGFAQPDPPGGKILISGNFDTSPAIDAGDLKSKALAADPVAARAAVAGSDAQKNPAR
jgi:hypothetical protein